MRSCRAPRQPAGGDAMKMNELKWVFVIAVAACSKGGAGDPAKCAEVTGAAVDRMMGGASARPMPEEMKAGFKERGEKLKGVIAKHCVDDKWSSDVLDCYAK